LVKAGKVGETGIKHALEFLAGDLAKPVNDIHFAKVETRFIAALDRQLTIEQRVPRSHNGASLQWGSKKGSIFVLID